MFQSFNSSALPFEQSEWGTRRPVDEASALIRRYPNLTEIELARLINLYPELSSLDMALMLSDEKLTQSLDQFSADHRSKIRTPFRQYAALVAYALVGTLAFAWAASLGQ